MTDDPRGPAANFGESATAGGDPAGDESASGESSVDSASSFPGSDRRPFVYLVPTMSSPADADTENDADTSSSGTTTLTATGAVVADRAGAGGAVPGVASPLDQDQDLSAAPAEREDWVWVQEWRAGQEPTPWATGIALAVFSALLVGVAVWVLSAGLADRPVIAVLVNLLVAAGLTPAIWLSRGLPVLRWIAGGAAAGIIIGWVSAILMLPIPAT